MAPFSSSPHRPLLLLLLLLLISTTATPIQAANTNPKVFLTVCGTSLPENLASFNLISALILINKNVSKSGFGIAITGTTNSSVYGLAQCFNYLSSVECRLCFTSANIPSISEQCLRADGRVYLDGCFVRIAGHSFFQDSVDSKDASQCSNSSISTSSSTLLNSSVGVLMSNLTTGAGSSGRYYKAGSAVVAPGVTVYGMAQCWRSMNASGCRDCLEDGRKRVVGCLPASDGKALNAGCFVRYSTFPFYLASTSGSSGSAAHRHRLIKVLVVVLSTLGVIGSGTTIFWMTRSVNTDGQEDSVEIIKLIAASRLSFKYEVLQNATENFSDKNKLGQGGYGTVYKGILQDGRVVAVKRLLFNARQRAGQFFNEVTLVNQVQHKNLVELLGCSIEGPESLLVYEYLCNISLEKFLYDNFKKNVLDFEKRFDIIVGTAEGLAYLHSSSEVRIIHRDIKASNILLDEKFKPKIADFGLARYFGEDQTHLSTVLAGTFGYMAPEYIFHGQLTEKADTYSYGILVIEIITGRQITYTTSTEGHSLMSMVWQHFCSKSLNEIIDDQILEQCSEEKALRLLHVGLLCTQASPILRPHMWKVVEMLTNASTILHPPTVPAFINIMGADYTDDPHDSINHLSTSTMHGR